MKSLFNTLGKITIFLLFFSLGNFSSAESPAYLLKVANESQPVRQPMSLTYFFLIPILFL